MTVSFHLPRGQQLASACGQAPYPLIQKHRDIVASGIRHGQVQVAVSIEVSESQLET